MLVIIDGFRPGTRDAVRSLVPPASLEVIDGAAGSSWLEVGHHHFLVDATVAVLGMDEAVSLWRRGMAQVLQRPLHKVFVEGAVRLFFDGPGRVIQLIPRGWPLAYRDFSTVSFQRIGTHQAEIRFDDVAPQAFASPGYLHSWHAICQGIFDLERPLDGVTEFSFDEARATAVIRFAWRVPARKP
ncbi:MAG: hypothetical protein IPO09_17230 [Anaeromyxobacter sp.]|nr:hypothetical protein [Anaeromyxobacter sp.]